MKLKKKNFNINLNLELRNKSILEQNISNTLDSYVYLPLLFLLFLSIVSGFLLSDIFLGIGSNFFSEIIFINPLQKQIFFEKHFEIFSLKYIPILVSLFFFFSFNSFNIFLKKYKFFYYFFKLKIYFDFVFNFFSFFFYKFSYTIFLKNIDGSFLQILGPFGIIRYFYFLSFNLNKFNLGIFFNYICFFLFFFFFFFFF